VRDTLQIATREGMLRAEVATRDPGDRRQIKAALEAQDACSRLLFLFSLLPPFFHFSPFPPPTARSIGGKAEMISSRASRVFARLPDEVCPTSSKILRFPRKGEGEKEREREGGGASKASFISDSRDEEQRSRGSLLGNIFF